MAGRRSDTRERIQQVALDVSLDEILAWARAQRDPALIRSDLIRRIADLTQGQAVRLWRFIQENQPTLKQLNVGNPFAARMTALFEIICADVRDPAAQLRARLALVALVMGNNPEVLPGPDRSEVALHVALELASPREGRVEGAT